MYVSKKKEKLNLNFYPLVTVTNFFAGEDGPEGVDDGDAQGLVDARTLFPAFTFSDVIVVIVRF